MHFSLGFHNFSLESKSDQKSIDPPPPFGSRSNNLKNLYLHIVKHKLTFPRYISYGLDFT